MAKEFWGTNLMYEADERLDDANEPDVLPEDDPIAMDRDDPAADRLEADTAFRPITGWAPASGAVGDAIGPTGLGQPLIGGALMGGPPVLLGLDVSLANEDDDALLAEAAESALAEEPRLVTLAAVGIEVRADKGVVTLAGTVPTEADREIAEETVARLPGATAVENRLTVEDAD